MKKRFFIIGTMGSGKTTLSRKIAKKLEVKPHSLDDFYWTTKYTRKRNPKIRDKMIRNLVKDKSWVIEGVFSSWVGSITKKADLVIWLDMPSNFTSKNILKRYVKQTIKGEERERGNFKDVWKVLLHARKYRTGTHKNSYIGHLKVIRENKSKYVRIKNKSQLKQLENRLLK